MKCIRGLGRRGLENENGNTIFRKRSVGWSKSLIQDVIVRLV